MSKADNKTPRTRTLYFQEGDAALLNGALMIFKKKAAFEIDRRARSVFGPNYISQGDSLTSPARGVHYALQEHYAGMEQHSEGVETHRHAWGQILKERIEAMKAVATDAAQIKLLNEIPRKVSMWQWGGALKAARQLVRNEEVTLGLAPVTRRPQRYTTAPRLGFSPAVSS